MFDWFWSFLYLISKTLFKIIDGLVQCANYLCGVDPVKINGEEVDFLEYILTSNQIGFAFRVAALLGMLIVVVFSVIAILRTLAKEKAEGTPAQIVGKAIKSILSFLFIPMIMIVIVNAGNIFMNAMYEATLQGYSSLGDFLFKAFAMESMKNMDGIDPTQIEQLVDGFLQRQQEGQVNWRSTSDVWTLIDLSEFEFIFSWIACGVILGSLGMSMMYFVSRVISIAILYIAAPFSIGASILDDGARFKLWREQILIKFITGYGMMIAINVYAMICLLVMQPGLEFFGEGTFIDYLMKLLLIAGGGVSLKQSMALIGNLISNGAGSNELRDAAIAGGLSGLAGKIPGAGLVSGIGSAMKQEITGKAAQKILPNFLQRSYGGKGGGKGGDDKGKDSKNGGAPNGGGGGKPNAKDAITAMGQGGNKNESGSGNDNKKTDNTNDNKTDTGGIGNQLVNSAIQNGGNNGGGFDDLYDN